MLEIKCKMKNTAQILTMKAYPNKNEGFQGPALLPPRHIL